MGISDKEFITSLGLKTIIRQTKIKKERFAITEVSLKDISKIIKEFKDIPYKGHVRKRLKQIPTESHLYLAIQIEKCMMSNLCGSVRTNNKSTQKITNLNVCSTNDRK